MKRLMYNLLETLAQEAGCSAEAWELVAEFSASELAVIGDEGVTCPIGVLGANHRFDVPTETMIGCLSQDTDVHNPEGSGQDGDSYVELVDPVDLRSVGNWRSKEPARAVDEFGDGAEDALWMRSVGFGVESFREIGDGESVCVGSQHPAAPSAEDED